MPVATMRRSGASRAVIATGHAAGSRFVESATDARPQQQ
jgi:hypothetical protein